MPADITALLVQVREGDAEALERLAPMIHQELKRIARNRLRGERAGHTLQPTALIHEAYLKLLGGSQPEWESRAHFFAVAARLMRQILTDHARARATEKRDWRANVPIEEAAQVALPAPPAVVALDDALQALAQVDRRKSQVIEMRYFAGLTSEEIGAVLKLSIATVQRDLRMGEAWLKREMAGIARPSEGAMQS